MSETNGATIHNVIIIGSGPAGLTAAIYTSRAMLEPVVASGFMKGGPAGGQLMMTTDVENYPGYPEGVLGPDMMKEFRDQAARFGTIFEDGTDVQEVDLSERPFTLKTDKGEMKTQSIIIATGASANWLDRPGVSEFTNRGVTACATCDGALPIFRDQELYVIGGGDTAMEEAMFLTRFGKKVYIVHRRDELRASKTMASRALAHEKIDVLWNTELQAVLGSDQVQEVELLNNQTQEISRRPAAGVFMAIGHTPNTSLFNGKLEMDETGYLIWKNPPHTFTSVEGVFAAGDVADYTYRQAVTAAGSGCAAAIDAERWLAEQSA